MSLSHSLFRWSNVVTSGSSHSQPKRPSQTLGLRETVRFLSLVGGCSLLSAQSTSALSPTSSYPPLRGTVPVSCLPSDIQTIPSDIGEAAAFIEQHCQQMLSAARARGKFLYRGETGRSKEAPSQAFIATPTPDLLDPSTYSSFLAADYFRSLNSTFPVDRAHIGSSDLLTAARWGSVHSVWPVGNFSFLWLKDSPLVWDNAWSLPQGEAQRMMMNCLTCEGRSSRNALLAQRDDFQGLCSEQLR